MSNTCENSISKIQITKKHENSYKNSVRKQNFHSKKINFNFYVEEKFNTKITLKKPEKKWEVKNLDLKNVIMYVL